MNAREQAVLHSVPAMPSVLATRAEPPVDELQNPAITQAVELHKAEASAAATAAAAIQAAAAQVRDSLPAVELFGSFFLGDDEFALSANCIREVVNFPEKVTAIPLSPAFLEGVFTLRGVVIPMLNLGKIFNPNAAAAEASHKIAIVDFEQIQIGIVFHGLGEILRVRAQQRSTLHYRDAAIHGIVAGTIRFDDSARLLQILDPAALVRIENIPQVLAQKASGRDLKTTKFHLQTERRQCVSFRIGGTAFAFEMQAIREIIEVPELKDSVMNHPLCLGRITLRGDPVAVIDFAKLLNVRPAADANLAERRIVIVRIGDAPIGLLVDSVDNIFSFFADDVLPIPLLSKTRAGMFAGCIHQDGAGEIIFLNHQEIFSGAELLELSKGHTNLYQQQAQDPVAATKSAANRQVYITFSLDQTCAIEIKQIREIIDFSSDMVTPPSMPPAVHGILNLRRQMITVINLRTLYGMAPLDDLTPTKILVFEQGTERYGMIVDAVENIVTVPNSDRLQAPQLGRAKDAADLRSQMPEVIEVAGENGSRNTFSVFDIGLFLQRLQRELAN